MKQIKYALYRDDEILYVGTKEELARYLNVSVRTISYYNTLTYKRRVKSGYKVYIIEDDVDGWVNKIYKKRKT